MRCSPQPHDLCLLNPAHSWDLRRMLLRRRASVALFLTVFSFTDWICSARHCSVGGGGAGQWDVGRGLGLDSWWPRLRAGEARSGVMSLLSLSPCSFLPACMGAHFAVQRCSAFRGQCCWVVRWVGQVEARMGRPVITPAPVPSGFGPTILTNLFEAPSFSSPSPWQTLPIHPSSSACV